MLGEAFVNSYLLSVLGGLKLFCYTILCIGQWGLDASVRRNEFIGGHRGSSQANASPHLGSAGRAEVYVRRISFHRV